MTKACTRAALLALLALAGCAAPAGYSNRTDPCAAGEMTMECQAWRYQNTM